MLEAVFIKVLNMSFSASFVIVLVMIVRLALKKVPKSFSYALWFVVLFRLLMPFNFESIYSLLPVKSNPIPQEIVYEATPIIDTGIQTLNRVVNSVLPPAIPTNSINPLQVMSVLGQIIWVGGFFILLSYNVFSYIKLRKKLKYAMYEEANIYRVQHLETPFVLGLFKPKIYLPCSINDQEKEYILLHEQTHIQRYDHVFKALFFLALCVHWFNPFVWMAFYLSNKDMEMSCDEKVIKQLGTNVKKEYSNSLLNYTAYYRLPLAFGEGNPKGRIKNILNYKKPTIWLSSLLLVVVVGLTIGLISSPPKDITEDELRINKVDHGEKQTVVFYNINQEKDIVQKKIDEAVLIEDKSNVELNSNEYFEILLNTKTILLFSNGYFEDPLGNLYESQELLILINQFFGSMVEEEISFDVAALLQAKTPYVGDNSAIAQLLSLLPLPNVFTHDHFELETDDDQKELKWVLQAEKTEININQMTPTALLLFALVDNLEHFTVQLVDKNGIETEHKFYSRFWANNQVGKDIRLYSENLETLNELVDLIYQDNFKNPFIDIPSKYSVDQAIADGMFVVVHGQVQNESLSKYEDFIKSVEDKTPAQIDVLQYTIEGDPILTRIDYDGSEFTVIVDYSRDNFGDFSVYYFQTQYLLVFDDDDGYTFVLLTDNQDLMFGEEYKDEDNVHIAVVFENK